MDVASRSQSASIMESEFPTARPAGIPRAEAARDGSLRVLCESFASFAVKAFDRQDREESQRSQRKLPKGARWKRPRLPRASALERKRSAGIFPPARLLLKSSMVGSRWPTTPMASTIATSDQKRASSRQIRPRDHRPADLHHRPLQLQVCLLPHRQRRCSLRRSALCGLHAHGAGASRDGHHESSPDWRRAALTQWRC